MEERKGGERETRDEKGKALTRKRNGKRIKDREDMKGNEVWDWEKYEEIKMRSEGNLTARVKWKRSAMEMRKTKETEEREG